MELIKNLIKYVVILIVVALFAVAIFAGILFIFPNMSLFGFKYRSNHDDNFAIFTDMKNSVTKINVETNNYDITIMPNANETIKDTVNNNLRIVIHNDYMGFINNDVLTTEIQDIQDENNTVAVNKFDSLNVATIRNGSEFTIKLIEPKGILTYGNSSVIIYVPEELLSAEYNLKTDKGNISFAKNSLVKDVRVSTSDISVAVSSAKGTINLDNIKMESGSSLKIVTYLGKVTIDNEYLGNVEIISNTGNFTFKSIGYEQGGLVIGGNLTVTGNNPAIKADKIYGNVNFGLLDSQITTGYIEVKEIKGTGIFNTKNGTIKIDKLNGAIDCRNESGTTTINQIGTTTATSNFANFIVKSGTLNLGKTSSDENAGIYNNLQISSESGRVVINELKSLKTEVSATSGTVEINYNKSEIAKELIAKTTSGQIKLTNLCGNVAAESETGGVNASYYAFNGTSTLKTDSGNITISVPAATTDATKQYKVHFKNKNNKLNIALGGTIVSAFSGDKNEDGYYEYTKTFPETSSTTSIIDVTTISGKISLSEKD